MLSGKIINDSRSQKKSKAIIWFSNDQRIADNELLYTAALESDQLLCLYIVSPNYYGSNRYGLTGVGWYRDKFLWQSLSNLEKSLKELGQELLVLEGVPSVVISALVEQFGIKALYRDSPAGADEVSEVTKIQRLCKGLSLTLISSNTLFNEASLPFDSLADLPRTFSAFRKKVESQYTLSIDHAPIYPRPEKLPPPMVDRDLYELDEHGSRFLGFRSLPCESTGNTSPPPLEGKVMSSGSEYTYLNGGENVGQNHLEHYLSTNAPGNYKLTRNALDGWDSSTKFSPWLALGNLTPRQILYGVRGYEENHSANESTYWIAFELLWREYFYWYAKSHGVRLFRRRGILTNSSTTGRRKSDKCSDVVQGSFYPERYKRWCNGTTPYPLVNACMNQLRCTGFMSNRGRQIVASCFIHELELDWRYGAAYFEQHLIDYDVASNWGNWQYLAGVGADPRGPRHFNINKQQERYDPQELFINKWNGHSANVGLDSLDMTGWPI